MRTGTRLGIDWGEARIGVAACDPRGALAYPVETVPASPAPVDRIVALVAEYDPIEIVVGLPRSLAGGEGPAAARIREHAAQLARALPEVPLRLVDERLTTVSASRMLTGQGRKARRQRSVIDQAAAVAILTDALEAERSTGQPPGEEVTIRREPDRGGTQQ
ncbi:putative Holliday junction resolvase [Naumannella cuiyingiana]|uniref:Putative pre-16S rRNA nuclease n=1 Tax=Naumannella cuiyingiana TaxID=1347891 RepID=A0A7Z0D630_9ACTN|nr:Holliday junction resolvase RuvX [Naumannella cuiyingiana]NYI69567.1 putative Holliday junction resolvase [Naumannella cuiyingiana]